MTKGKKNTLGNCLLLFARFPSGRAAVDLLMRETRPKKVFRKSWKKVSIAFFFSPAAPRPPFHLPPASGVTSGGAERPVRRAPLLSAVPRAMLSLLSHDTGR